MAGAQAIMHQFVEIRFSGNLRQPNLLGNELFDKKTSVIGVLVPNALNEIGNVITAWVNVRQSKLSNLSAFVLAQTFHQSVLKQSF